MIANKIQPIKCIGLIAIAIMTVIFLSGCSDSGCTNIFSDNYDEDAIKDDGSCILAREKFIGTFLVNENCESGLDGYELDIYESDLYDNEVAIVNLNNVGGTVYAIIEEDFLEIPDQRELDSGAKYIGSGSIIENSLAISFSVQSYDGYVDNCTFAGVKLDD